MSMKVLAHAWLSGKMVTTENASGWAGRQCRTAKLEWLSDYYSVWSARADVLPAVINPFFQILNAAGDSPVLRQQKKFV